MNVFDTVSSVHVVSRTQHYLKLGPQWGMVEGRVPPTVPNLHGLVKVLGKGFEKCVNQPAYDHRFPRSPMA